MDLGFEPTYEELKQALRGKYVEREKSFEPTYEELKRVITKLLSRR